jgi:hypothetical protein
MDDGSDNEEVKEPAKPVPEPEPEQPVVPREEAEDMDAAELEERERMQRMYEKQHLERKLFAQRQLQSIGDDEEGDGNQPSFSLNADEVAQAAQQEREAEQERMKANRERIARVFCSLVFAYVFIYSFIYL